VKNDKELDEESLDSEENEEIIDIGDDFRGLEAFGDDPTWEIPLIRRVPNPKFVEGGKEKPVLAIRYWAKVKLLTQMELMRMSEGKKIPKGSRNIVDNFMINRYSKTEADMLNVALQRGGDKLKITNDPRGKANYAAGEISIHDLSREDISRLEVAISPGVSKSSEDFEIDVRSSRRSVSSASKKSGKVRIPEGDLQAPP
jgi:hypothetical protein